MEQLKLAIQILRMITEFNDVRWLAAHIRLVLHLPVERRGINYNGHLINDKLAVICDLIQQMPEEQLPTLLVVVDLSCALLKTVIEQARGQIQVKTTKDGFNYCYVRIHSSKGNTDRKRNQYLSIYADLGMGPGGIGGYVAAALEANLVTKDDILDAWHLGSNHYTAFIYQCAEQLDEYPPNLKIVFPGSTPKLTNPKDVPPLVFNAAYAHMFDEFMKKIQQAKSFNRKKAT